MASRKQTFNLEVTSAPVLRDLGPAVFHRADIDRDRWCSVGALYERDAKITG
jgi:hypothetical protein